MVKELFPKGPTVAKPPAAQPYSALDPVPVPDVVESDTDSAWGLWEDSIASLDARSDTAFENTEPAKLPPKATATPPKPRA